MSSEIKVFNLTPKAWGIKEKKNDKMSSIKTEIFCSASILKRIKRQTIDREKVSNDLYQE